MALITSPATSAAPSPNPIFIIPNSGSAGPCTANLSANDVKSAATGGVTVTTVDAAGGRNLTVTNLCTNPLRARVEDSVGNILGLPTIAASGSTVIDITGAGAAFFYYVDGTNNISVTDDVFFINSETVNLGDTPPPVLQQFGKPSNGTCDEAAPADLNWGGSSSGGWGDSWARWMNDGAGGEICTRTLVYSNSSGRWGPSSS